MCVCVCCECVAVKCSIVVVHTVIVVQGYKQHRGYIIAQAPMESTCRDFWKMVYDRRCGVIIMLSELVEQDKVQPHHLHTYSRALSSPTYPKTQCFFD